MTARTCGTGWTDRLFVTCRFHRSGPDHTRHVRPKRLFPLPLFLSHLAPTRTQAKSKAAGNPEGSRKEAKRGSAGALGTGRRLRKVCRLAAAEREGFHQLTHKFGAIRGVKAGHNKLRTRWGPFSDPSSDTVGDFFFCFYVFISGSPERSNLGVPSCGRRVVHRLCALASTSTSTFFFSIGEAEK